MTKCPACGFWKLNEFIEVKQCKKCNYRFIPEKKLEQQKLNNEDKK